MRDETRRKWIFVGEYCNRSRSDDDDDNNTRKKGIHVAMYLTYMSLKIHLCVYCGLI